MGVAFATIVMAKATPTFLQNILTGSRDAEHGNDKMCPNTRWIAGMMLFLFILHTLNPASPWYSVVKCVQISVASFAQSQWLQ